MPSQSGLAETLSEGLYPPPDPVNAMLSFGYTLLMHDVLTAVHLVGLDPYLGVFHTIEAGRASLALDLMEEFRPLVIDRLVLTLLQTNQVRHTQFDTSHGRPDGVYLDAAGREMLIGHYETMMHNPMRLPSDEQTPLRRVIVLQAQAVARLVRDEQAAYVGYTA